MTAVLLDSTIRGSTGWISLRGGRFAAVSGLQKGDRLVLSFIPKEEELSVEEDGYFPLPDSTKFVKVQHCEAATRARGASGVNVDIVRKRG